MTKDQKTGKISVARAHADEFSCALYVCEVAVQILSETITGEKPKPETVIQLANYLRDLDLALGCAGDTDDRIDAYESRISDMKDTPLRIEDQTVLEFEPDARFNPSPPEQSPHST